MHALVRNRTLLALPLLALAFVVVPLDHADCVATLVQARAGRR